VDAVRLALVLFLAIVSGAPLGAAEPRYRVALVSTGQKIEELAARRILQTMGIPYDIIPPAKLKAQYPLAILPGPIYNTTLTGPQREAIYGFVSEGGVLLVTQVEGTDYFPLLGIEGALPRRDRFAVRFAGGVEDAWLRYLDHPKEREISLGDAELFEETIWSVGYKVTTARKLAAFPDGTAAAVVSDYDAGQVLALGVSLTQSVLLAQIGQGFEAGRQWINSFEPSGDVLFLLVKGMYEANADPAISWHTVPGGRETAIVLSHDIDAQESFRHSVTFAKLAQRYGVFSTFFVTTKTFADASDIGYFDAKRIPYLVTVRNMGFEIGSHSLSHSSNFASFPMGAPTVTLASYRPATSPSVIGELKVSKELLDKNLPKQNTVSFRAGELAFPPRLIKALAQTGYRYDSTFSANDIITNFPFFAFEHKHLDAPETRIVEIPVTVDDSRGYLTAESKERVVKTWSAIIEANRANGAITCILIHPTEATYKLAVLQQILERFTRENVWIGNVAAMGDFWVRRTGVGLRLERRPDGELIVRLDRDAKQLGGDLSLVISGKPVAVQILDKQGQKMPTRVLPHRGARIFTLQPKRSP
jgi:peptidoglycan/xylan/chitin deacetylase (PgdA/CDA1 family)